LEELFKDGSYFMDGHIIRLQVNKREFFNQHLEQIVLCKLTTIFSNLNLGNLCGRIVHHYGIPHQNCSKKQG
jgi:hypothetical protein